MDAKLEAKSLGKLLRDKREELLYSLKDVESAISVKNEILQSIEEGSAEEIVHRAYVRGFIRSYAAFLGMDVALIQDQYPHFFSPPKDPSFDYGIGTLEERNTVGFSSGISLGWWFILAGLLFTAALFFATWKGWV